MRKCLVTEIRQFGLGSLRRARRNARRWRNCCCDFDHGSRSIPTETAPLANSDAVSAEAKQARFSGQRDCIEAAHVAGPNCADVGVETSSSQSAIRSRATDRISDSVLRVRPRVSAFLRGSLKLRDDEIR